MGSSVSTEDIRSFLYETLEQSLLDNDIVEDLLKNIIIYFKNNLVIIEQDCTENQIELYNYIKGNQDNPDNVRLFSFKYYQYLISLVKDSLTIIDDPISRDEVLKTFKGYILSPEYLKRHRRYPYCRDNDDPAFDNEQDFDTSYGDFCDIRVMISQINDPDKLVGYLERLREILFIKQLARIDVIINQTESPKKQYYSDIYDSMINFYNENPIPTDGQYSQVLKTINESLKFFYSKSRWLNSLLKR